LRDYSAKITNRIGRIDRVNLTLKIATRYRTVYKDKVTLHKSPFLFSDVSDARVYG
jgi:hypothetical protein